MQWISSSLLNFASILISSIIMFTIEQTTTYMKYNKATRIIISFKCIDFVELNLIELICTFFFLCLLIVQWFLIDIVFIFSSIMLRNICLNNIKKISSNSWRRISIGVFNICLIISIESNYFLMFCVNFLNLFEISTILIELNLVNFNFLYLTFRKSKLISTRISFIATSTLKISIDFKFLLKTTLFVRFIAFE